MDHPQTPRILASHLDHFQHRHVRITGKVVQLRGESAIIDADGNISVLLNRDAHLAVGHAVEIIGKVQGDLQVRVLTATDLGPATEINFDAVKAVVDATHRHREIFYDAD